MGWILLIAGVAVWWAAHLFKRALPERRAAMGDRAKGGVALALVAAIVLMWLGYANAPYVYLYQFPPWTVHLNNLLILIAIYLMTPAPKYGRLIHDWRHPMLTGFGLWAGAHLLVNGSLAGLILFGGLLAWAVVTVVVINRSDPPWPGREGTGRYAMDAAFFAAAAVALVVIGYIHAWLGVWPFGT